MNSSDLEVDVERIRARLDLLAGELDRRRRELLQPLLWPLALFAGAAALLLASWLARPREHPLLPPHH